MKKFLALILATMMLTMAFAALAEDAKVLIMATNASFPPYEYVDAENAVDPESGVTGIDAEIAAAIAAYMGYTLKIDDMEFDSIIAAVASGKADFGMAGMTVTADRLEQIDFSASYATGVQVVIVKEDSAITSVDDLIAEGANHIIGVQLSTTGDIYASEDIEEAGFGTVERYPNGNEAVMALIQGKIDCVIIDNEPAKAYVAANPGLKILDSEYAVENYAACIKKGNTELLEQFNAALKVLTEDGTIPAIIEKYIPSNVD